MADAAGGGGGVDLAGGIALSELAEGVPLAGRLGEDEILLVRRGSSVHAIGATCTHYGGPLAEGLVVGDTVRCPWHHACFSLVTGEALAAPALNPVTTWAVEIRDGRVHIGAKQEAAPLSSRGRSPCKRPDPVVIVGSGAAGSAAAEMLRREGFDGRIVLVDPDRDAPYDRPNLSKDYLQGTAPEEWIPLRPDGFYEEHGIERIPAGAGSIDRDRRVVLLESGVALPYSALLLATGSTPRQLTVPGAEYEHVHTLRSLADCRAIIARVEKSRSVVIAGASFIGMEVAASLRQRGLDVTVVAPDRVPFERTLGAGLGAFLRDLHTARGVGFRLGRTIARVDAASVVLDDGEELAADLVIVGVGVQPNTGLAEGAGLAVDNGVLVDEYLRTSDPCIYAAGDIARWHDARTGRRIRVEHWVVAQRQGQTAARNILGRTQPFTDVPFFWTMQFDTSVRYVGHAPSMDEVRIEATQDGDARTYRYLADDTLHALATISRDRLSLQVEAELEAELRAAAGAR